MVGFVPLFLIDFEIQKILIILTDYNKVQIASNSGTYYFPVSLISTNICTYSTALFKQKNPKQDSCTDSRTDFQKTSKTNTIVLRHNDEVQADLSTGVVLGIIWREDDAIRARVLATTGCCKRKPRGDRRVYPYQSLPWNTNFFLAALRFTPAPTL